MALNPSRWSQHWIRPEIVPLFAAVATGMGLGGFMAARHVTLNPDVRVNKEDREAGILDNYKEGKTYKDHGLRSYLRERRPEIMPAINDAFSKSSDRCIIIMHKSKTR